MERRVWIWRDDEDREVVYVEGDDPLVVARTIERHVDAICVSNMTADENGRITVHHLPSADATGEP